MKHQTRPVSEIKKNPQNPRTIKDDNFKKLVNSIKSFPQMLDIRPIVINADGIILGGNMRFEACKAAGLKEVPVILADNLTEEQQREFIIKDNVSGGEWDWEALHNEWDVAELAEWGLLIHEVCEKEINDLSSSINNLYRVEVICKDEEHQEKIYNKLIEEGQECRLLTL